MYTEKVLYAGTEEAVHKLLADIEGYYSQQDGFLFAHHLQLDENTRNYQAQYRVLQDRGITDALFLVFPECDDETDYAYAMAEVHEVGVVTAKSANNLKRSAFEDGIAFAVAPNKHIVFEEGIPSRLGLWKPISSLTI